MSVNFIKSKLLKDQVRKYFLSFYLDENYYQKEKLDCCDYDIYRIKVFIDLARKKLNYDVFEHLVDFLVSIVQTKTKKCFDHLRYFDCFHYFPLYHYSPRRIKFQSLVQFYKSHNFNLGEPFLILNVHETKRQGYLIEFCCRDKGYCTLLPKSEYDKIEEEIDYPPIISNFYGREVYFRINNFLDKKYPILECRAPMKGKGIF